MSGFCQERPLPSPPPTPEHRWLGLFSPQSQEGITLDHIQLEASHPGLQCPLHWLEGGRRGEDRVTRPHAGLPERKGVGTEAQGSPSPHGHLRQFTAARPPAGTSCGFLALPYHISLDKNQC